jgi:cytidylate kinase
LGRQLLITIDGPAGAGKSTLGRRLAQSLGYRYVDSGALYRAVAWQVLHQGADPGEAAAVTRVLAAFHPRFTSDSQRFRVAVDGRDITAELRSPEVSQAASRVATLQAVRRWVGDILHELAQDGGVVAEGRDLGSVVFPEAEVKFYLNAELTARAARRQQEWQGEGNAPPLPEALQAIVERDTRDRTRETAPLVVPEGAVVVDTTNLSPEEVAALCLAHIREKRN